MAYLNRDCTVPQRSQRDEIRHSAATPSRCAGLIAAKLSSRLVPTKVVRAARTKLGRRLPVGTDDVRLALSLPTFLDLPAPSPLSGYRCVAACRSVASNTTVQRRCLRSMLAQVGRQGPLVEFLRRWTATGRELGNETQKLFPRFGCPAGTQKFRENPRAKPQPNERFEFFSPFIRTPIYLVRPS